MSISTALDRRYHAHIDHTIDIILRVPGLETARFCRAMRVALVTEQFSVKHPYTGRYQAISPYTTMADKEMTFCTIFVNSYLRNAKVYPQSRPSMKNGRPSSRHLRQQNEAQRSMRGVRGTPI